MRPHFSLEIISNTLANMTVTVVCARIVARSPLQHSDVVRLFRFVRGLLTHFGLGCDSMLHACRVTLVCFCPHPRTDRLLDLPI